MYLEMATLFPDVNSNMASSTSSMSIPDKLSEIRKKWKSVPEGDSLRLFSLVEELGPYLTSTNHDDRLNGMSVLADVITETPSKSAIKKKEADHLIHFFCEHLKDHHSIIPHVLKGILSICYFENFPEEQVVNIARTVFHEVHVPSHFQSDRYHIYSILFKFLQSHLKELQKMGSDFVFEFIQVMDGERDPKCLLLALHIIPVIVSHFDIGLFVEDLFEVFSCYFPVDFNPPANDPLGITREDLNAALQNCFLSTTKFSNYCFPLLLEKLDADLLNSKLDSLELISLCCQKYNPESLKPFLLPIIMALCKEAITTKQDEVQNKILHAFNDIFKVVSASKEQLGGEDILNELLNEVWKECEHFLHDSELLQLHFIPKILQAIAASSEDNSSWILSKIFPHFLQMFSGISKISSKETVLDILSQFIECTKQYANFEDGNNPFQKFQEPIVELYYSSLNDSMGQFQSSAINGLRIMLMINGMIGNKHHIIDSILKVATTNKSNSVRTDYTRLLSTFALHQPVEVKEKIIPPLFDEILAAAGEHNIPRLEKLLEFLVSASCHSVTMVEVVQKLVPQLTSYYSSDVLHCIARSLLQISKIHIKTQSLVQFLYSSCIRIIIEHCVKIRLSSNSSSEICHPSVVDVIGMLLRIVVQQLDNSCSASLVSYLIENTSHLQNGKVKVTIHQLPGPHQYMILVILRSVLGNLHRNVYVSKEYILVLAKESQKMTDNNMSLLIAQCISALLNKMPNEDDVIQLVDTITKKLVTVLDTDQQNGPSSQEWAAVMWIWIIKGLLLRGYTQIEALIQQMIFWLSHNAIGKVMAYGFCTVLQEVPEILTPQCNANVKILYRQQFFVMTLPHLLNKFESSPQEQKCNYLTAICHQLKFQANAVLISELPILLPIILQSLCCKDAVMLISVLSNLDEVMNVASHLFEEHVYTLIPQLLQLTSFTDSMKVRMMSIRCLRSVTHIPHHLILPFQKDVTKRLAACLDDKKRLVRKEAVLARCEWFLIS